MKVANFLRILVITSIIGLTSCSGSPSSSIVNIPISVKDQPIATKTADGFLLVYEFYIDSYKARGLTASRIDILNQSGTLLKSYVGDELNNYLTPTPTGYSDTAVLYVGIALPEGTSIPSTLHHVVYFTDGTQVSGADVAVATDPIMIAPPVRGSNWYVGNGPTIKRIYHRDAILQIFGKYYVPERFAVDWVKLGPDGRGFTNDGSNLDDWYGYNSDILAVADGTIVDTHDGFPDNSPVRTYPYPTTIYSLGGNYVVLDIGDKHTHFAYYGHFIPNTIKVKIGDRVTTGQLLGKLGSSGNSGAPHLHFHICDGSGPMGKGGDPLFSNGLPFTFSSFTLQGSMDFDKVDAGGVWTLLAAPQNRTSEMPLGTQIIDLGS